MNLGIDLGIYSETGEFVKCLIYTLWLITDNLNYILFFKDLLSCFQIIWA